MSLSSLESKRIMEKPKRCLTAYNFFFQEERQRLLDTLPAPSGTAKPKRSHGKIGFENLAREISARWKKVTAEEKAVYLELARKDKERYTKQMEEWRAALEEECAQLSDQAPPEVPRRTRTPAPRVVSRSESPEVMPQKQPSEATPQVTMEQALVNNVVLVNNEGSLNVSQPTVEGLVMEDITLDFWDINDPMTVESAMVQEPVPVTDASAVASHYSVEPQQVLEVSRVQLPDGSAERNSIVELANKLDQDCQDFLISTFA